MKRGGSRYATLDMRGRLVIDVHRAVADGFFDDELDGSRMLGLHLARKKALKKDAPTMPIPYEITDQGRAALEGRE